MRHYLLTAAGPDRPGIVAAISRVLFRAGCNLEDSAMTRLGGEFAVLLVFSSADGLPGLERRLGSLKRSHGLNVHLKPMAGRELRAPRAPGALWLVTVYGADRPGIVYRVTDLLARKRANVTDVTTHRTGGAKAGYILYLEAETARGVSRRALESALKKLGRGLGVTVTLKPAEPASL